MADAVADAGPRGAVVATLPEWYDDPRGKTLDPATAVQVRQDTDYALSVLPHGLAGVLRARAHVGHHPCPAAARRRSRDASSSWSTSTPPGGP